MSKTRLQKEKSINDLVDKIAKAKSIVLTSQRGLEVKYATTFRANCMDKNVEYLVSKKTILKIAFKKIGFEDVKLDSFDGIVGVVLGYEDEIAPSKISFDFSKDHAQLVLHNGVFGGVFVDSQTIIQLAKLPSKEELLANVIGSMNAPISGFVRTLSGTISGFVRVLDQIRENKSQA